jgi:hypothetical protein
MFALEPGNTFGHQLTYVSTHRKVLDIEGLRDVPEVIAVARGDLRIVRPIDFDGPKSMSSFLVKSTALRGSADSHVRRLAVKRLASVVAADCPEIDAFA